MYNIVRIYNLDSYNPKEEVLSVFTTDLQFYLQGTYSCRKANSFIIGSRTFFKNHNYASCCIEKGELPFVLFRQLFRIMFETVEPSATELNIFKFQKKSNSPFSRRQTKKSNIIKFYL